MSESPYSKFNKEELILRDYLATDRTILANERTFLAYVRTALTVFGVGVSFVQFFDSVVVQAIGWVFMPLGVVAFITGLMRYRRMKILIQKVKGSDHPVCSTGSGLS